MNNVDISDRCAVERAIAGALKNSINSHGPIDYKLISSASKRIYGQLKNLAHIQRKKKK